jgi:D-3-phosphoglycerate dehydrogenase / 2-oxoglutarate reductase
MKTLFIDCNVQFEKVFRKVHRADDPAVAVNNGRFGPSDLPRLLDGYDICIDDHSYMPTPEIAQCKALKHIVFCGTGASSYMDVPALAGLGVTVHTYRGYGDTAVAEHTIALMFACARDVALCDRKIRGGTWEPLEGVQLNGKTLGVVGLGGIGREVARIGAGIGMTVIGWNRTARPESGVPEVPLDELLARADVVSLNLSLTDETRGFLDAGRIARIKPGAILVNTARGALVDEAALVEALASGRIGRAALDVFHAEPIKAAHPLARMDNVTLSPHAAFRTPEASENLLRRALDIVRKVQGYPPV